MPDQIIFSYTPLLVYELTNILSRYLERQKSCQVCHILSKMGRHIITDPRMALMHKKG
jgi:hypothetical protein